MSKENAAVPIGQLLRDSLQQHELSMRKLGELTRIDSATISRIINDKRKATLDHLEKFSAVLDIPLAQLVKAAGYPIEPKKEQTPVYNDTIQQLLDTSKQLSAVLSAEAVENQLAQCRQLVQTPDGKRRVLQNFENKLKQAGGIGPFADQMNQLFSRFKTQAGSKRDLAVIGSALLYFIIPIDVIPDYIFAVGYLDDAIAVQIAASYVTNNS